MNGSETEKLEAKLCEKKKGLKRKHAKFHFYFFAKKSENQAKRIPFRFGMRNNEKKKEAKRAHPTSHIPRHLGYFGYFGSKERGQNRAEDKSAMCLHLLHRQ
jgi:hypothetical protein